MKYVALLRGINVGGNNVIKKDELKSCFEEAGFWGVRTYIQSGNIVFVGDDGDIGEMVCRIQDALSKRLHKCIPTLVLSEEMYRRVLASAPDGWGQSKDDHCNVSFVIDDSDPVQLVENFPDVVCESEHITPGFRAIFWRVSLGELGESFYVRKLSSLAVSKKLTIRTSGTAYKILGMLDQ